MKKDKILPIVTSIFVTVIVFGGTALVFLYANGYRFNREEGTLDQTGVISISAKPFRSDISLDGKYLGKTPKSATSLSIGTHKVVVSRDGYHDWVKNVLVQAEKSTPVYSRLFKSDPEAEDVFKIDNEIVSITDDQSYNYTFVTTRKELGTTQAATTDATNTLYQIWRYNINPSFWELSQNPVLVYEQELTSVQQFLLQLSPDGQSALLTTTALNTTLTTPVETTLYQLLNTAQKNDDPNLLDLSAFAADSTISWASDNQYLVIESENELATFNSTTKTKHVIRRNNLPVAWNTNADGVLFLIDKEDLTPPQVEGSESTATLSKFVITQSSMEGGTPTVFIDDIYTTSETAATIEEFKEPATRAELQTPFESSENGHKLSGDITGLVENEENSSIVLHTTLATYWYTPDDNRYVLMLPEPSEYIGNAEDDDIVALNGLSAVAIFTYDKEEADHTAELGSKIILSFDVDSKPYKMHWVSDSDFLSYADSDSLRLIDADGDNMIELTGIVGNFYMIDSIGKYAYALSLPSDELLEASSLVRYQIQ